MKRNRQALSALVILCLVNISIDLLIPYSPEKLFLSDVFNIFLNIAVLLCLWSASEHFSAISPRFSSGWKILFLAQLLSTLGDIVWAYFEIILHSNPFPSAADIFYIANYPVYLAGIILLAGQYDSKTKQINTWLDSGIVFVSISIFVELYVILPIINNVVNESIFVQLLSLAYPVGDLILLSALIILIYQKMDSRLVFPTMLITLSLAIQIITDFIFSNQSLQDTYVSAGFLDIGWAVSYLALGVAGYLATDLSSAHLKIPIKSLNTDFRHSRVRSFLNILPYLLLLSVFAYLIASVSLGINTNMYLLLIGTGVLLLLVLTRQYLALTENYNLNINLNQALHEAKENARRVEKSNEKLQFEIAERKKVQSRLVFNALHDPLTRLPNRSLFTDRLEHAIAYSKRHENYQFSVLFLDIDNYKIINDSLGHIAGDDFMIQFSKKLKGLMRKSDTLARFGGDEFALLIENESTKETSATIAERIHQILQQPFIIDEINCPTSVSIGILEKTKNYSDAENILKDADYAMYQAKARGKACTMVYTPALRERT